MGRTLLCVLELFLLNSLLYGLDEGFTTLGFPTLTLFEGGIIFLRCKHHNLQNEEVATFFKDGSPVKLDRNHQSHPGGVLVIDPVSASDDGSYTCEFDDREKSEAKYLKVEARRRSVTLTAETTVLRAGRAVTLTCSVEDPPAGLRYEWFKRMADPAETSFLQTQNSYELVISKGGEYSCRGYIFDFFTRFSDAVTVEEGVSNRAVLTIEPSWTPIFTGETVTVRCEIEGGDQTEWTYEWIPDKLNSPPTLSEYRVIRADYSDSEYLCKGSRNYYSSTKWSDVTRLDVFSRPKAELEANSRDVPVGGNVTLTCSVRSSSGWKFFWYRGEKTSEPLTSKDGVLLSTERISVSWEGLYWCRGGRGEPVYYTEYSDSVIIHETVANRAVVTLQPNWSEIYRGETITLSCEIKDGGDTEWEYEWRKNSNTPLKKKEYLIRFVSYKSDSGSYSCRGRMRSSQQSATDWSDPITLTVSDNEPKAVLTVSPSWPSPGDSVTLNCSVEHPSAGWRFSWYKAVPKPADGSYSYELLPDSTTGTEQDSYSVHGQTHTAGYVCRAARGDPVYYTYDSELKFVWSGDSRPSASLSVSPDRVQHFTNESLSLSCEGNSAEWRVRRFTDHRYLSDCSDWGTMTGSTCNINIIWSGYTGVYWCESGSGEFSNAVNITAQERNVILVSPVRPVTEGDSVSLSCRLRKQKFVSTVFFYRNDKVIQNDSRRELNISAVSKSDEGFYKCGHSREDSPQSWMSVRGGSSPEVSTLPVPLVTWLLCGMALIIVLLLLLFCYRRTRDSSFTRPIQSESTNQGSATGHMVDQDEAQRAEYSSLLHCDASVYETIRGPADYENDAAGSQEATYSSIELKEIGK